MVFASGYALQGRMYFLILILAAWGLTNIVSGSLLFRPARAWFDAKVPFIGRLLRCYMCFGFWAGILISLMTRNQFRVLDFEFWRLILLDGWICSGTTWIIYVILVRLGSEEL